MSLSPAPTFHHFTAIKRFFTLSIPRRSLPSALASTSRARVRLLLHLRSERADIGGDSQRFSGGCVQNRVPV